jgi:hypothetical protein
MTIQTEDIPPDGVLFTCDNCDRSERRPYIPIELGGHVAQARHDGYRIGDDGKPVYCPECAGTDGDYWAHQTMAILAAIDAGNTTWGAP